MGFRYAVLTSTCERESVRRVFCSAVLGATAEISADTSVSLPNKLEEGAFLLAQLPDRVVVVFPFELISAANYDLSDAARQLPGQLIAIGQDDTTGETWFQGFQDGNPVAEYHCGDGVVVKSLGEFAFPGPAEWDESDVFGLLPESLHLDDDGTLFLAGLWFRYEKATDQSAKDSRKAWWKIW